MKSITEKAAARATLTLIAAMLWLAAGPAYAWTNASLKGQYSCREADQQKNPQFPLQFNADGNGNIHRAVIYDTEGKPTCPQFGPSTYSVDTTSTAFTASFSINFACVGILAFDVTPASSGVTSGTGNSNFWTANTVNAPKSVGPTLTCLQLRTSQ